MDFNIVFSKNRSKLDKYIKLNKIRNKVIIDIKEIYDEEKIYEDFEKYQPYFNLLIYNKIISSLKKDKDIFYLPNFNNPKIKISDLFYIKEQIKLPEIDMNFNCLFFYEDLDNLDEIRQEIFEKLHFFDSAQIIKDY